MEQRRYDYSTLEVDDSQCLVPVRSNNGHDLPEPQPCYDLPEALPSDSPEVIGDSGGARPQERGTLYGLRRKTFWVAMSTAATLIAIFVAIGVGVGVTRTDSSSPAEENGNSTEPASPSAHIASFSHLAAANYTDRQQVPHTQVYYQDDSLNIWMADLDFRKDIWTRSQVNTTGYYPKRGTPLAAFNYMPTSPVEFHVRFVSETHWIRAIFFNGQDWKPAPVQDNGWSVTNESNLGDFSVQCENCEGTGFMVFHSEATNDTAFAYPYNEPSFNNSLPDGIVPDIGTAYVVIPIQAIEGYDAHPYAGLYLSVDQALKELYFATGHGVFTTKVNLTMTIDAGAQIAAMAYTHNDLRYVQVLVTRETGGVQMAYVDGWPTQRWTWMDAVGGMEKVVSLSPISATQIGRVYALEDGEDGRQIVEFNRTSTTGIPKFERLGPLNITTAA